MSVFDCDDTLRAKSNAFYRTQPNNSVQHGFTLLELIIAVAILALIALGTGAVLNSVIKSNETSEVSLKSLQDAQRAMLILERDFLQMVARSPRIQGEDNAIILKGGEFEFDSDESGIAFVRNGWHNPQMMLPRSSLQRVIYSLQDGVFMREHFMHVDSVIGAKTRQRPLLEGITDFEVSAAFEYRRDELDWEKDFESLELPIALKVTLESEAFGSMERVFQVAP